MANNYIQLTKSTSNLDGNGATVRLRICRMMLNSGYKNADTINYTFGGLDE